MFLQLIFFTLIWLPLATPAEKDKIDSKLKAVLKEKGQANVVFRFGEYGSTDVDVLESHRSSTQKNALNILSKLSPSVKFHSLWISNRLYIQDATPELVEKLAALEEVWKVREEYVAKVDASEWGIDKIQADVAWTLEGGNKGEGVVVAAIDTGARATHEALKKNYRASYGWFDGYDDSPKPVDEDGHGTHVVGTIAGTGGIGVAPGAQWIACRACKSEKCTETALSRCAQWIFCPTLPNGGSPNCSMAPQVISNSWSSGNEVQTWFDHIINMWHMRDMVPVFSIGNPPRDELLSKVGSCGAAAYPAYAARVIGVGSTTEKDSISTFSYRGPSAAWYLRPDVTAPGSDIRSAWGASDTAYNTISGTSMAAAHVSGTVALLLSRYSMLSFDQINSLLQTHTDRSLGNTASCGNTPSSQFPNNIYGYGRINARKSLAACISVH